MEIFLAVMYVPIQLEVLSAAALLDTHYRMTMIASVSIQPFTISLDCSSMLIISIAKFKQIK